MIQLKFTNFLKSKWVALVASGTFSGTVIGTIGSGAEVSIIDFFFFLFTGVGLGLFMARRLTIASPARAVTILVLATIVFVLTFIPVMQYFILGNVLRFDILLSLPILVIMLISLVSFSALSGFLK